MSSDRYAQNRYSGWCTQLWPEERQGEGEGERGGGARGEVSEEAVRACVRGLGVRAQP